MRIVQTVGQAFEVCHKQSMDTVDGKSIISTLFPFFLIKQRISCHNNISCCGAKKGFLCLVDVVITDHFLSPKENVPLIHWIS